MEGDQLLDYLWVLRSCLPPSGQMYVTQFPPHRRTLRTMSPPSMIFFTDASSCALDSLNMGLGEQVFSRESFQLATDPSSLSLGPSITDLPFGVVREALTTVSPSLPAIKLDDRHGVSVLKSRGLAIEMIGGKKNPPRLQQVLGQNAGVFLYEFHWLKSSGEKGWHVIGVNCDLRLVFCNTLGVLPFTYCGNGKWKQRESKETHDAIAKEFRIVNTTRVYRLLE